MRRDSGVEGVQVCLVDADLRALTMEFRKALVLLPAGMASGLADAEMRTLIAHECVYASAQERFSEERDLSG